MERFVRLCDRISHGTGVLAGIMMLLGVAMVAAEIIMRTFFSKTLYITEEFSGYLMVGITFLGLAYTLKEKGHIRMVFLQKMLKGKSQKMLDVYTYIVGLAFFVVLTYTTANFAWDSLISQSRSMQISGTYLAIPQSLMPIGSAILTLQFAAELVRSILQLRSGEIEEEEAEAEFLGR